jgi:glucose-1-phosphatase
LKFSLNNIDSIIFDLGGVLLNLDPQKTFDSFAEITGLSNSELIEHGNDPLFKQFERGEISSQKFRDGLNRLFQLHIENSVIDHAWNAMLLDIPKNRIDMIGGLQVNYKTFVLSNTNEIHSTAFDKIVGEATGGRKIQEYFSKIYYSHKVGMRKPEPEIFEMLIDENKLNRSKTLFIDDTLEHIKSANRLGLQTWHLTNQEELYTVFGNG